MMLLNIGEKNGIFRRLVSSQLVPMGWMSKQGLVKLWRCRQGGDGDEGQDEDHGD